MGSIFAAVALVATTPAHADTLIDNVNGITLDEKGAVQRFAALVIGTDGHITRVLASGEKRPPKLDYRVNGKGRVLLPGMIDAHAHVMAIGFAALTLDLSETDSLADAQARIARYARDNPDRAWILGRGWDQDRWALGRFPTAGDLDAAVGDRPVWLLSSDGQAGWANSAALAVAGVTAATNDPAGGRILRAPGGKPSGVLVDKAAELVEAKVPPPRPVDRDLAFLEAQRQLVAAGFTTVTDMGTSIADWQAFRRAGDLGKLRMRIIAYAGGTEAMALIGGPGPSPWLYDDRLRLAGVRLRLDGSLGSRGAALKAPYADDPGNSGLTQLSQTQLGNLMSRAAIDKFQVAVEATGDRAVAMTLGAIGELSATYKGDRRWRIEQAQVVDPADLGRFGGRGIVVSVQLQMAATDQAMNAARLGPVRLTGAQAWKSILDAGGVLAFGGDAAAGPFDGLATALSRTGADGQPFGGWQPQQRLSREAALAAWTTGAAYAGFAETRLGRIAPGLRADFVLVDQDPILAAPDDLHRTRVLETWVSGQAVYRADQAQKAEPRRAATDSR
ncbi:MAG: amidohydrolase family protein [Novosphingobium sp.]